MVTGARVTERNSVSELGDRYRQATNEVLKQYETEKDGLGRCQKWKLAAIESDRISGNDSGLMKQFMEDVEATVNRLEAAKNVVATLCKEACKSSKKSKPMAVQPAKPAEPIHPDLPDTTDTSVHGIDLGWD